MMSAYDPAGPRCLDCEQPGLQQLRSFALARWGGQDLGIYACRRTRSGRGMSLHAEGRAWDWRAPSRAALDEFFTLLISYAVPLGIQAIHDYETAQRHGIKILRRRWQQDRGWYWAAIGHGAGGPTCHVEMTWAAARSSRPITERIATATASRLAAAAVVQRPNTTSRRLAVLPVIRPISKAGPRPQAGNRLAFYTHNDTHVLGWNGAALAGDVAWPLDTEGRTLTNPDQASIEGRTFRALAVPLSPGAKIIGLSYGVRSATEHGPVYDFGKICVYASDGAVYTFTAT